MYQFINMDTADQIRVERIHHLEIQHYRLALELEETPDSREIRKQMDAVEQRIGLHRKVLGIAPLDTSAQENGQAADSTVLGPDE
jgi:hypothetical protein